MTENTLLLNETIDDATSNTSYPNNNRVFSRDITAAMLVLLEKGTAAMLVSPINPPGIEL